ncbi:ABC transporter permease subunit [Herbidospora mongoliensis]|uniref:ABC transporter permease subunit n=1 Tax=Herbidospora mongoliensis TaxID=688067 RepID=UPI00082C67C8|nr:ABC transporter permease subunit [Herbidospora mongoliensis]
MTWLAIRQHRIRMISMALVVVLWAGFVTAERLYPGIRGISASLFAYLPLVMGVFLGAPLLSREYERGTHQFAWTQSVTRSRWLAPQVITAAVLGLATTGLVTGLIWWSLRTLPHELTGLLPFTWTLFAVALGTFWSAVTRRTTVAMGSAFFGVAACQLIAEGLRNRATREFGWAPATLGAVEAAITAGLAGALIAGAWWFVTHRDPG